ncbi:hypothetical protein DFH27DRAFT_616249 [Peziza echinospora]|nr:hypothetical protein DFH27DRAFT_616249 [Peziza echinospora]
MDEFFARYRSVIKLDSSDPASTKFTKLCEAIPSWSRAKRPPGYHRARQRFGSLLQEENLASGDPVRVFFGGFEGFDHDHAGEGVTAQGEFERLQKLRGWKAGGKRHKRASQAFLAARDKAQEMRPKQPALAENDGPADDGSDGGDMPDLAGEPPRPIRFRPSAGSGPLDDFFRSFHGFEHNVGTPSEVEFERLTAVRSWAPRGKALKKHRSRFMNATVDEFHWHLNRDDVLLEALTEDEAEASDAEADGASRRPASGGDALQEAEADSKPWRRLCEILDVRMEGGRRRPRTEEECTEVLKNVYINIFLFILHMRQGEGTLRRFSGIRPLARYSYRERKVFPLKVAEKSPILKFLLQPIGQHKDA